MAQTDWKPLNWNFGYDLHCFNFDLGIGVWESLCNLFETFIYFFYEMKNPMSFSLVTYYGYVMRKTFIVQLKKKN